VGLTLCPTDEQAQDLPRVSYEGVQYGDDNANRHEKASLTFEARKEKSDSKKNFKASKSSMKESMSVTMSELVRISGKQRVEEKQHLSMRDAGKKCPTLMELQEKKYPFPDSNLLGMLDELLEKGIIELPPSKHREEAGSTNGPKYCRYHWVVSHPLEKCITPKECIMQLAKDGTIILNLDEAAETNHMTIWCDHCHLAPSLIAELITIQFGSLEQMVLPVMVPTTLIQAKLVPDIPNEDNEG